MEPNLLNSWSGSKRTRRGRGLQVPFKPHPPLMTIRSFLPKAPPEDEDHIYGSSEDIQSIVNISNDLFAKTIRQ